MVTVVKHRTRRLGTAAVAVTMAVGALLTLAGGAAAKTHLNLTSHLGAQVNQNGTSVCIAGEACQGGLEGFSGGWFAFPKSVAVNQETHDVYVVDNGNRVQELSSSGAFIREWGVGVVSGAVSGTGTLTAGSTHVEEVSTASGAFVLGQTVTGAGIPAGTTVTGIQGGWLELSNSATASGAGVTLTVKEGTGNVPTNEQQTLTVKATSGAFQLEFTNPGPKSTTDTTAAILFNAPASGSGSVQESLESLPNVGPGGVSVSGGPGDETGSSPYVITFTGRYADTNVEQLGAVNASLSGGSPSSEANVATTQEGATVAEVCTVASDCQIGREAGFGGALSDTRDITVDNTCYEQKLTEPSCKTADPSNGDVYVYDNKNHRIDKFDSSGRFLLAFGGEINPAGISEAERNRCVAGETCQEGKAKAYPADVNGFLPVMPGGFGGLLAVGGPGHMVYVGMQGQVEAFDESGQQDGELTLPLQPTTSPAFPEKGKVTGLTVDAAGDVYVTESHSVGANEEAPGGVYEYKFNKTTKEYERVAEFDTSALEIESMTLDPVGRLTIIDEASFQSWLGVLFRPYGEPQPMSTFGVENGTSLVEKSLAYDDTTGRLYATKGGNVIGDELNAFSPVTAPETITGSHGTPGPASISVSGEVNPESSTLTASSFVEYGPCAPAPATCATSDYSEPHAQTTPAEESGESFTPVTAELKDLLPNQEYHYRISASNREATSQGSEATFRTAAIAPVVAAGTAAPYVHSESAVLSGSLNPENAPTHYAFEYVTQAAYQESGWASAGKTISQESSLYGSVGVTQEAAGLQSGTTYRFRLTADNEFQREGKAEGGTVTSTEGTFTTLSSPVPQVAAGQASAVTSTSATISGTVEPNGEAATYAFELGVYDPAGTQYGTVASGDVGSTGLAEESQQITGLQPGTTYAYRIRAHNGHGESVGATVTFTTQGLPAVLAAPPVAALLQFSPPSFPSQSAPASKCKRGLRRNARGKCVAKPKKARHHKASHHKKKKRKHKKK